MAKSRIGSQSPQAKRGSGGKFHTKPGGKLGMNQGSKDGDWKGQPSPDRHQGERQPEGWDFQGKSA